MMNPAWHVGKIWLRYTARRCPMPNPFHALCHPPRAVRLSAVLIGGCLAAACAASPEASPGLPPAPDPLATSHPDSLVWALPNAPETLDPSRMAVDEGAAQVSAQVYDRLLGVIERPDGSLGLSGGLAESWESDVSGRTFTFTLRKDLVFQDGTPLNAPAVKWNIERWMDPDHEAHDGIFRGWRAMFGGYVGENDASDRPRNLIERVEALDALTVRIALRAPFAPLPHHLATAPFGIASPTAVRAQGAAYGSDGDHLPVGSGPFQVVAWDKATGAVRLDRFEGRWWGKAAAPGLRFQTIPEPEDRAAAVASGQVDGADLPAGFPITGTLAASLARIVPRPARATAWLVINVSRPPLDDLRVRQAISLALDRDAIVADHFGSQALPATQILPPGFAGHDSSIGAPAQDVERARALMAEAGMADGFQLNIWVPSSPRPYLPDPEGAGEAVATMLRDIGLQATAMAEPMRRVLDRRASGRATAWILGWEAQSLDSDNFWYWHFSPSRAPSEGQYTNPALGTLLLQAQQSIVPDARERDYRAAAQLVAQDVPRLFLGHARPSVAIGPNVTGFVPGPLGFDDLALVAGATGATGDVLAAPTRTSLPEAAPGTSVTPPDGSPVSTADATPADATPATPATP